MPSSHRMRLAALAVSLLVATTLAGCSSPSAGGPSRAASAAPSSGAAFPASITHALGTTTIEEEPVRVAAVGWSNQEVPLALGIVPVGMPRVAFGDDDGDGVLPWVEDRLKALGAETPALFDETSGIDFEAVAGTRPDVILAAYSGLSQDDYDTLSRIAPVVAYPDRPWTTSLDDMILLDSEALGLEAQGRRLVETLDARVAAAAAKAPGITGRTVAFVSPKGTTDLSSLYVYTTADPRAAFFEQLGMRTPEVVKAAGRGTTSFYSEISAEEVDRLKDVDVLVLYGDAAVLEAMRADPLLSRIPAIRRGSVVALGSDGPLAASANPTPLSVGWGIDAYVDLLSAAAARL